MISLTPEQNSVVQHNHGPALVFAVAGAGKTTAMVHRIARLVEHHIFAPQDILATSFSKATVKDIQRMLTPWPQCLEVHARTLHGLGFEIIRWAQKRQFIAPLTLPQSAEGGQKQILYQVLRTARQDAELSPFIDNLDHEDFLNYVQASKARLAYANLADIPEAVMPFATQAEAPEAMPHYLNLYQAYETLRQEMLWLTFDDMLVTAFEILCNHQAVLTYFQDKYKCVLVDEYQDINHVQYLLLDLLVKNHRNIMAIGDDDQTIYEWRGADPKYILEFETQYKAQKYLIRENFRSQASHVALANAVIAHNTQREPKQLNLTQGFDGDVHIHPCNDPEQQGKAVAEQVHQALKKGYSPSEIAILLRIYAQTPFIEQYLIDYQIPYRIIGSTPFYQRNEIKTFLAYLYLSRPEVDEQHFERWWRRIYNFPKRYLSRHVFNTTCQLVLNQKIPLVAALKQVAQSQDKPFIRKKIIGLAEDFEWVGDRLKGFPAADVLSALDKRLGFADHLRNHSGFPETGEAKAQTVEAFIDYAKDKGDVHSLMQHLREVSFEQSMGKDLEDEQKITLTTAYRAKGLEWPVVMIPGCNHGIFPMGDANLEAERRLFYVALTRPQEILHLFYNRLSPVSLFLRQAQYRSLVKDVSRLQGLLKQAPETWSTDDTQHWVSTVPRLKLHGYFRRWWDAPEAQKTAIAHRAQLFILKAKSLGLLPSFHLRESHGEFWRSLSPDVPLDQLDALFPDLKQSPTIQVPKRDTGYDIDEKVEHPTFGAGKVVRVIPGSKEVMVMIDFRRTGRTLIPMKELTTH